MVRKEQQCSVAELREWVGCSNIPVENQKPFSGEVFCNNPHPTQRTHHQVTN